MRKCIGFFITNYEGIHAALLKYYLLKLIKGKVRGSSSETRRPDN